MSIMGKYNSLYATLSIDTEVLGYPVVRIIPETVPRKELPGFLAHLAHNGVRLAVWMPCGPNAARHAAEWSSMLHGLAVTPVRANRIYSRDLGALNQVKRPQECSVELLKKKRATEEISSLALQAGIESRYHHDHRIPAGAVEQIYRRWIALACLRDGRSRVFAVRDGGAITGMTACRQDDGKGVIMLLAVSGHMRRKGVASCLVGEAGEYYRSQGCTRIEVATREDNTGACAFYESCGYTIERRGEIYHLWFGSEPPNEASRRGTPLGR